MPMMHFETIKIKKSANRYAYPKQFSGVEQSMRVMGKKFSSRTDFVAFKQISSLGGEYSGSRSRLPERFCSDARARIDIGYFVDYLCNNS